MRMYPRDQFTNSTATTLSRMELVEANTIGSLRATYARQHRSKNTAGFDVGAEANRRGARGELGAAKILQEPWNVPYSNNFRHIRKHADVGGFEVRTTARREDRLIIREKDRDEAIFILALEESAVLPGGAQSKRITLLGWAFAGDAKRDLFLKNPPAPPGAVSDGPSQPAWFYPRRHLRPMSELLKKVRS